MILIPVVWSLFTPICVYYLLSRDEKARLERLEQGDLDAALAMPEPAFAAVFTLFLGVTAPYFLARSLGAKGLALGFGLLLVSAGGTLATTIVLS